MSDEHLDKMILEADELKQRFKLRQNSLREDIHAINSFKKTKPKKDLKKTLKA